MRADHNVMWVAMDELENLKKKIIEDITAFHRAWEKEEPFVPGKTRIPYAGRMFDHRERVLLTEACFDFWLTAGPFAARFEKEFSEKLGVRHTLLANSGSSANLLALSALTSPTLGERAIRAGDEVITVAAGFPTTVAPIIQNAALPVFLDVTLEDGTYNVDIQQLEDALSPKTRAVFLAHTLGNPFPIDQVLDFCRTHDLWLIEDNCDALGSRYRGRFTGTFGDLATSSFYPPHHLTMGEGGAVYTNSPKLRKLVASFRDWGKDCWCEPGVDNSCGKRFAWSQGSLPKGYDHKYTFRHFGYNLKVTDMQAAIGCAQLEKLDQFTEARKTHWQFLFNGLADLDDLFVLPRPTAHSEPSWFGFPLTVREQAPLSRDEMVAHLEERLIQTRMLFAGNLTRQPCFHGLAPDRYRVVGDLSNTDRIMNHTFWVGVYPGLSLPKLNYMIASIREAVGR